MFPTTQEQINPNLFKNNYQDISFFCGKAQPKENCCFQHIIGLPRHPSTLQQMGLMPYQTEFFNYTVNTKHNKFHVNKSRQIGFTEIVLRILAYHCFNKYAGHKIMIVAGTREKTTKKIMQRFAELFHNIPDAIIQSKTDLYIKLANGTEIEGFPSNSDAIRGDTKIAAIFIDEAAHFKLIDDSVVMNAIKPIVDTNKSDLYMISTPNGMRGFFYEIDKEANDYMKLKYNIHQAIGFIYTKADAERMLKDKTLDGEQEYLNQYTTTERSIFHLSDNSDEEYEAEIY